MRFDNANFRSLNETISHIDEPQVSVDEYTELLESVLLALCDELELDPNELMEAYRMTPEREKVLSASEKAAIEKAKKNKINMRDGNDGTIISSHQPNSPRNSRRQEALSKIDRIAAIRRKAAGVKEPRTNTLKIRRNTHQNRRAVEMAMSKKELSGKDKKFVARMQGDEYGDKEPKGREGKFDFRYNSKDSHPKIMKQVKKAAEARKQTP